MAENEDCVTSRAEGLYTASETHVGSRIVKTLVIKHLTSIDLMSIPKAHDE